MKQIKAVVFDMDGTLFDTEQVYHRAWREAGAKLKLSFIEQALADCTGRNMTDTRRYFEENFADEVQFDIFAATRDAAYEAIVEREGLTPKVGALEALQWLKAHQIPIALGTSTYPPRVMQNLQRSGFAPYFDVLVTGDMVKCGKPHPETFLMAAELLGVLPEHCMGVEDSFHGVRAIHDAGMFTVMVPDMHQPDASVLPLIDAVCENLFEIQHLVEKINRWE